MKITPKLLLILSLLIAQQLNAQVQPPANYNARFNVAYTEINGWQGLLDLYMPKQHNKAMPLVINIHGGGWVHGKKEEEKDFVSFFDKGYVIANVEYRIADQAPAPAAIQDVRCALFYLINHAQSLGININQIVLMGGSAGGHLALMAGLLQNQKIFKNDCAISANFHIVAIIDRYGPTDLNKWDTMHKASKASSTWLGGRGDDSVFVNSLSPIYYVSKQSPPVFIVHGDKDHTVPYQQSVMLYNKLRTLGIPTEMYTVAGGMHGNFKEEERVMINQKIDTFLAPFIK